MDLNLAKLILQIIVTTGFFLLAAIGFLQKDFNFGFAMNLILGLLYVILYFHPLP